MPDSAPATYSGATMSPELHQAVQLVEAARNDGAVLRVLGGIAVALHSPSATHRSLQRAYADMDFVTTGVSASRLDALAEAIGYSPDRRFNSLHGRSRRLYFDASGEKQIDVFVDTFEMCHILPLADRLEADFPTIPLAELFLSKAQIVHLNRKDVQDLVALLADHPIGPGDEDTISAERLSHLTGRDWGLWRTVRETLTTVERAIPELAPEPATAAVVRQRVRHIAQVLDEAPKTIKWKARARVGDRVCWYELPEDPRRPPAGAQQAMKSRQEDPHDP